MTTSRLTTRIQGYFDEAAETYDKAFTDTLIGRAEREAVRRELRGLFHSGERILELNCGTGVDAIYLGESGVQVLACDIAPGMIKIASRRLASTKVAALIDFRVLPTEDIAQLSNEGPFDGAFSNFGGLNCVEDLRAVARNLARLLKPGAPVLLCMGGRFVPLEIMWHLAHGHPRKALRRLRPGADDVRVKVHYPSVSTMVRLFAPEFRLVNWKGIGVAMPPAFLESWAQRFPKLFHGLANADLWVGRLPALRHMAGHMLLQFERAGC